MIVELIVWSYVPPWTVFTLSLFVAFVVVAVAFRKLSFISRDPVTRDATLSRSNECVIDERFVLQSDIASGAFFRVVLALDRTTGQYVAVKLHVEPEDKVDVLMLYECGILVKTKTCAHVLQPLAHGVTHTLTWGSSISQRYSFMVCPLGVDLASLSECFGPLTERLARCITKDLVAAVTELAEHKFVHHDIKPNNFLLMKDGVVRISDMNSALPVPSDGLSSAEPGNELTRAPETRREGSASAGDPETLRPYQLIQADVWSIGSTVFYLLFCEYPLDDKEVDDQKYGERRRTANLPSLSTDCARFLKRTLDPNPDSRHSLNQCSSDLWLQVQQEEEIDRFVLKCLWCILNPVVRRIQPGSSI